MSLIQQCDDIKDIVEFCKPSNLYFKPYARLNISVQLPQLKKSGCKISNFEIVERLKDLIRPTDAFSFFKVVKSSMEFVRFEAELRYQHNLDQVVSTLDMKTIKLTDFSASLKVRAAESKVHYPTRNDWDSFFKDNKDMTELRAGERPDTIRVEGLPIRWFVNRLECMDKPSEYVVRRAFAVFGEVRIIDLPMLDGFRTRMELPSVTTCDDNSSSRTATSSCEHGPTFEVYVQYKEYMGFVKAMESLKGMKLAFRDVEANKYLTTAIRVDFDRTKQLAEQSLKLRALERMRLIELDRKSEEVVKKKLAYDEMRKANALRRVDAENRVEEQKQAEVMRIKQIRREARESKRRKKLIGSAAAGSAASTDQAVACPPASDVEVTLPVPPNEESSTVEDDSVKDDAEPVESMAHDDRTIGRRIMLEERRLRIAQRKLESIRLLDDLFSRIQTLILADVIKVDVPARQQRDTERRQQRSTGKVVKKATKSDQRRQSTEDRDGEAEPPPIEAIDFSEETHMPAGLVSHTMPGMWNAPYHHRLAHQPYQRTPPYHHHLQSADPGQQMIAPDVVDPAAVPPFQAPNLPPAPGMRGGGVGRNFFGDRFAAGETGSSSSQQRKSKRRRHHRRRRSSRTSDSYDSSASSETERPKGDSSSADLYGHDHSANSLVGGSMYVQPGYNTIHHNRPWFYNGGGRGGGRPYFPSRGRARGFGRPYGDRFREAEYIGGGGGRQPRNDQEPSSIKVDVNQSRAERSRSPPTHRQSSLQVSREEERRRKPTRASEKTDEGGGGHDGRQEGRRRETGSAVKRKRLDSHAAKAKEERSSRRREKTGGGGHRHRGADDDDDHDDENDVIVVNGGKERRDVKPNHHHHHSPSSGRARETDRGGSHSRRRPRSSPSETVVHQSRGGKRERVEQSPTHRRRETSEIAAADSDRPTSRDRKEEEDAMKPHRRRRRLDKDEQHERVSVEDGGRTEGRSVRKRIQPPSPSRQKRRENSPAGVRTVRDSETTASGIKSDYRRSGRDHHEDSSRVVVKTKSVKPRQKSSPSRTLYMDREMMAPSKKEAAGSGGLRLSTDRRRRTPQDNNKNNNGRTGHGLGHGQQRIGGMANRASSSTADLRSRLKSTKVASPVQPVVATFADDTTDSGDSNGNEDNDNFEEYEEITPGSPKRRQVTSNSQHGKDEVEADSGGDNEDDDMRLKLDALRKQRIHKTVNRIKQVIIANAKSEKRRTDDSSSGDESEGSGCGDSRIGAAKANMKAGQKRRSSDKGNPPQPQPPSSSVPRRRRIQSQVAMLT